MYVACDILASITWFSHHTETAECKG